MHIVPSPLRKLFSFLRPLIFNDLFMLAVALFALYVQGRFVRMEQESVLRSVHTFVNGTIAEYAKQERKERQLVMEELDAIRRSSSFRDIVSPGIEVVRAGSSAVIRDDASPVNCSENDKYEDEDEDCKNDDDNNLHDDIRYLYHCLNNKEDEDEYHDSEDDEHKVDKDPEGTIQDDVTDTDTVAVSNVVPSTDEADDIEASKTPASSEKNTGDADVIDMDMTKMKITELRKMASDRGVDTKGTKDVLVKRLTNSPQ
jgi:hypothetical protein